MTKKELLEKIESLAVNKENYIKQAVQRLKNRPDNIPNIYSQLISAEVRRFYNNYFNKSDVNMSKQTIYNIGRLMNLQNEEYKNFNLSGPTPNLSYYFLSDSVQLLEYFKSWIPSDYLGQPVVGIIVSILEYLRGNLDNAKAQEVKFRESFAFRDKTQDWVGDHLCLRGIIGQNKDLINEGVSYLIKPEVHNKRMSSLTFEKHLFSSAGMFYLKLAWILGNEIEISNPLIPMDLMPIDPLPTYEVQYFFLDGYKGEVPETYLNWKKNQENVITMNPDVGDFVWDDTKYKTRQEAIVIDGAIEQGYSVKKNDDGKWMIYNS